MRARTIGVLTVLAGMLLGGAALAQDFGEPIPNAPDSRILSFRFSDAMQPVPISGSRGAALCALTGVDDDTPRGFCRVFFDARRGEWVHQTGGQGGDNQCEATCLWTEESRPDPRYREEERPRERFGRFAPQDGEFDLRQAAGPACRAPRVYRFTLDQPRPLRCTPNRVPVFDVQIPDSGQALARASLLYANETEEQGTRTDGTYFWNAGVSVGGSNEFAIGDNICPGDETAPKAVLGFGRLEQGRNSRVVVTSTSGRNPCADGSVTALPGSTLEVFVEDPDPRCRGRDVGFATTGDIAGFREEAGWTWTAEPRRMLRMSVPAGSRERRSVRILASLEATPRKNPNKVCGVEGAGARARILVEGAAVAAKVGRFPASSGMGHLVLGLDARLTQRPSNSFNADLVVSTDAPEAEVFSGGCCGQASMGYVRE